MRLLCAALACMLVATPACAPKRTVAKWAIDASGERPKPHDVILLNSAQLRTVGYGPAEVATITTEMVVMFELTDCNDDPAAVMALSGQEVLDALAELAYREGFR